MRRTSHFVGQQIATGQSAQPGGGLVEIRLGQPGGVIGHLSMPVEKYLG
jgi:hypothetical protein